MALEIPMHDSPAVLNAPQDSTPPAEPATRLAAWGEAVDAFVADLGRHGYSSYTQRDYRTDVMRMAHYLDIPPDTVHGGHLKQMNRLLAFEGLGDQARRRRRTRRRSPVRPVHGTARSRIPGAR